MASRALPPGHPIRKLFRHMEWADDRVLQGLRAAASVPATALELYAHVLGSEQVWLDRLRQRPSAIAVWPQLTLEDCEEVARGARIGYSELIEGLGEPDLDMPVSYVNSAGQRFATATSDILLHVALHGAYHRGQIATLLRTGGQTPTPTDYIQFVRGAPAATRPLR